MGRNHDFLCKIASKCKALLNTAQMSCDQSARSLVLQLLLNFALKNESFAPNLRHEMNSIQGSKYYSLENPRPKFSKAQTSRRNEALYNIHGGKPNFARYVCL